MRVGLRFDRRDRVKLRELASAIERRELPGDTATFTEAARAAELGEPLQVLCDSPMEAHLLASAYVRYGCRQPAVEELTS